MCVLVLEPEFGGEQEMASHSFKMDVLGRPRSKPVHLPTVIKGGKPGAIPNTKVLTEHGREMGRRSSTTIDKLKYTFY